MDGSRLWATPVPEALPRLPNTIACTVAAVPQSSGMPCTARKATARALLQERKMAPMAAKSWVRASCGKGSPASRSITAR